MSNRVDYPGRTSCGCPYLNQPDPERHWKDCHYRLNAQQAEPAPAQDEREAALTFGRLIEAKREAFETRYGIDLWSVVDWLRNEGINATRPAQTEQQPVSWTSLAKLKEVNDVGVASMWSERVADDTDVALYAAPIAQTEQQPVEQWQVRYLPGQKVEERWWQDSTAERAAWCAEANAEQLAKGLPDVWEIRKFYAAPIAQTAQRGDA